MKIFVMGANQWREEDDWPLARAQNTKYFLHSSGKANSLRGDGSLSTAIARQKHADQYVYDPANPVPTIGGPLCCDTQPPDARPARSASRRSSRRRPGLLHHAVRAGHGSHRPGSAGALRQIFRSGYRLHRQAGRRLARRLRTKPDGRNHPRALPRLAGERRR